jgi:PmbA protein
MQADGDYSVARHFCDMSNPRELGKAAGRNAAAKLGATLPATGAMPIVLSHAAAESFFSTVYAAIDGTAVHRGLTFLKDKIGQQVMSTDVTLIDDPGIQKGLASSQIDGAGMKAEKIIYIDKGTLKIYNVSLLEARQLGIEPIGRDDGPTNSSVLPGVQTPDELIADIQKGIYIKGFNGGKVDVNDGTHSRQAYGTLIENGKITDQAVEGFVVSGNLKDMFMNVVLANDTPVLPSPKYTLAAPTTRINGTIIAGL